jgi:NAD-dependent deacetylase
VGREVGGNAIGALQRAAELLASATRGVAFTGAGISQESGIQTYRGKGGLWNTTSPKTSSIDFFINDPGAYWEVAKERGATLLAARPNPAHDALVELERTGVLRAVITQNVDGLHLLAGSSEVIELHGNGREVVCLDCGNREPRSHVQARLDEELPPRCPLCGGIHLKPAAVFFGEAMPVEATARAFQLAGESDLMLVVGTSLVVYPAAQVPLVAHDAGAALVIVNPEPTPFDDLAAVILRGRAGEILPELLRLSQAGRPESR